MYADSEIINRKNGNGEKLVKNCGSVFKRRKLKTLIKEMDHNDTDKNSLRDM